MSFGVGSRVGELLVCLKRLIGGEERRRRIEIAVLDQDEARLYRHRVEPRLGLRTQRIQGRSVVAIAAVTL